MMSSPLREPLTEYGTPSPIYFRPPVDRGRERALRTPVLAEFG